MLLNSQLLVLKAWHGFEYVLEEEGIGRGNPSVHQMTQIQDYVFFNLQINSDKCNKNGKSSKQ